MPTDKRHSPSSLTPSLPTHTSIYTHDFRQNESQKENVRTGHVHQAGSDKTDSCSGVAETVIIRGGTSGDLSSRQQITQQHYCRPCAEMSFTPLKTLLRDKCPLGFKEHVRFAIVGGIRQLGFGSSG